MEENKQEIAPERKASSRWKVVGINFLALILYSLICRFIEGGIFLDAFFVGIHFTAAIITSLIVRRWEWVLSAFLVLAIGFSSCVSLLDMPNMH